MPKENIASSVAVNTYYEPYYEAGALSKSFQGKVVRSICMP